MIIPIIPPPSPEQAIHVLEILEQWTQRGWWYEASQSRFLDNERPFCVSYTNPDKPGSDADLHLSRGLNHFDALCQATTVMQVLLEEHPGKTP